MQQFLRLRHEHALSSNYTGGGHGLKERYKATGKSSWWLFTLSDVKRFAPLVTHPSSLALFLVLHSFLWRPAIHYQRSQAQDVYSYTTS